MNYSLEGVCCHFGNLEVLRNIHLTFQDHSVTAIIGPSGCGKTSLLNILAGIITPSAGQLHGFARGNISYAFQEDRLLPWLTAKKNILFALSGAMTKENAHKITEHLLERAGLADAADKLPGQLSGGMRRRLSLVRAFSFPADVILLDEAFQAVDMRTRLGLLDCFLELRKEKSQTAICVSHDIHEAIYLADTIIVLSHKPAAIIDRIEIDHKTGKREFGSDQNKWAADYLMKIVT